MVGILLATHGQLAETMYQTAQMIVGRIEQVETVCLHEQMSTEQFEKLILEHMAKIDTGSGTLVLTDLMGGSPGNVCARLILSGKPLRAVSGVNLPMLLEVLSRREGATLHELTAVAVAAGQQGIRDLSELFSATS